MDVINWNVQIEQKPDIKINTAEADLIEIIVVRLGGENQNQKGLVDFLYGLFSGNQEKVLSYISDSDKPVRQKEVADMLSMISYAEENGIKKGENRLGTLMNILLKNKRYSDAEKASEDEEYHKYSGNGLNMILPCTWFISRI